MTRNKKNSATKTNPMKAFFLFFIPILAGCFGVDPQITGKEGKSMPDFNVMRTDSSSWFNTSTIPTGKPVALFYFSPFCPYCKAQTQEIIEEIDELKNIQFYFISTLPTPILNTFNKAYNLNKYPNIMIGIDTSHFVKNYFNAPGIPYLAIYNKDKKLNKSFLGKISANQIKKVAEE